MTEPGFRPGRRLERPADFKPDRSFTAGRRTYLIDTRLGVGARLATAGSAAPTVYFALEPAPPAPVRRRAHRLPRTLKPIFVALAAAAVLLLIYPYYPAAQYQVEQLARPAQAAATPLSANTNQLIIPAIGVQTPVVEGPSLDVLLKHNGVWHQTGALPSGSLVLAGHRFRYLPPNTSTLYNLGRLKAGDVMLVDWYGRRYSYKVSQVQTIAASDTNVLKQTGQPNHLYVYTCQDYRMSERILVTADLIP